MSHGWFNQIAPIAILTLVMAACDSMAQVPPTATVTLAPPPNPAATQMADLIRHRVPDGLVVCAADDAAEFEAVPGARPDANWAVIFEYDFTPDWSVGRHDYTLWFEPCPYSGELLDHLTSSIMVTSSEPLHASPVYFGPRGVSITKNTHGSTLAAINPLQTAIAHISDIQLTQDEAQTVAHECVIWISWDGGARHGLLSHKPCRY